MSDLSMSLHHLLVLRSTHVQASDSSSATLVSTVCNDFNDGRCFLVIITFGGVGLDCIARSAGSFNLEAIT